MTKFNLFVTKVFDYILYPFSFLNPFWAVFFLSFVSSIVVLIIYKAVSSPDKIKDAKDKIKGHILAIRIYRDHWKVLLLSFFKSLFYTLKYFTLNFFPIVFILPILFFVFAQMEVRYGYRPFVKGEKAIVKVRLTDDFDLETSDVNLIKSDYVKEKIPPVFVYALNEVDYVLEINKDSSFVLGFEVNGTKYEKKFSVLPKIGNKSEALGIKTFFVSTPEVFLYPAENKIKDNSDVKYIYTKYPSYRINFLGTRLHWLWHYLLWTLIIVLALKNKFGVEF